MGAIVGIIQNPTGSLGQGKKWASRGQSSQGKRLNVSAAEGEGKMLEGEGGRLGSGMKVCGCQAFAPNLKHANVSELSGMGAHKR